MKKSLTALILAAAMVLGLMAGCTSAPPETTAAPLPDLETLYNQGMEVLAQMGDEAPILFPETNIDYINNFYPGIADIEALRVWSLDNEHHAAEAVITTTLITWDEVEALKSSLRTLLAHHGIAQSVIEVKQCK